MENQVTSCCELHRLAEDDEIHYVKDEQLEEAATEGYDEDNRRSIGIYFINYSDQSIHETES